MVNAWGGSSSCDETAYGNDRDWMYDSTALSIKLQGCVWSYVSDNENAACMEDSSEDGTESWYMMANCRRANAAYSFYGTENGNSVGCSSSTHKETLVTTGGLSEFIYMLKTYDANSPFNGNDDDGNDGGWADDELPMCEYTENGYYVGVGCGSDGTFILSTFDDAYCLSPSGTYDSLDNLNYKLKQYRKCSSVYSYGDENNIAQALVPYSEVCSALDTGVCIDTEALGYRMQTTTSSSRVSRSVRSGNHKTWVTKLKYAAAGFLLLASFIMFTGILFTNRRRRRALMQRRARQSRYRDDKSRRSSKSGRSKSRTRSSSKRRSKSTTKADSGVMT